MGQIIGAEKRGDGWVAHPVHHVLPRVTINGIHWWLDSPSVDPGMLRQLAGVPESHRVYWVPENGEGGRVLLTGAAPFGSGAIFQTVPPAWD